MTLHFAAARPAYSVFAGRRLTRQVALRAANDNGDHAFGSDAMLRAAIKHFARHGVGAAAHAKALAEEAFFADDRDAYLWWLGVCRALDRRVAAGLTAHGNAAEG